MVSFYPKSTDSNYGKEEFTEFSELIFEQVRFKDSVIRLIFHFLFFSDSNRAIFEFFRNFFQN